MAFALAAFPSLRVAALRTGFLVRMLRRAPRPPVPFSSVSIGSSPPASVAPAVSASAVALASASSPLACLASGSSAGGEAAWRFPLIVYSTDARCYSELSNANTRASATRVQGNDGWVASGELELLFVGDQNMGPIFQVTYGKIVRNNVLNSLLATPLRGEARRPTLLRPGRRYPRYVIARFDPVAYDR